MRDHTFDLSLLINLHGQLYNQVTINSHRFDLVNSKVLYWLPRGIGTGDAQFKVKGEILKN